jgi:hypothetical protein
VWSKVGSFAYVLGFKRGRSLRAREQVDDLLPELAAQSLPDC